jgi:hypothetical protein
MWPSRGLSPLGRRRQVGHPSAAFQDSAPPAWYAVFEEGEETMGWMVPLLYAARKRREGDDEPCHDGWRALPLIVGALGLLALAVIVLLGIRVPTVALTLVIGGIIVALALAVLVVSLLR